MSQIKIQVCTALLASLTLVGVGRLSEAATISSEAWGVDPSTNGQVDWSAGNAGFTHAVKFDSSSNVTFDSSDGYGLTGSTTMTFYGSGTTPNHSFGGAGGSGSLDATNNPGVVASGLIPGLTETFFNRGTPKGGADIATLTLTGLSTNQQYELVLYQDSSYGGSNLVSFSFVNSGTGSSGNDTASANRGGSKISVLYTTGDNTSVTLTATPTGSNMHWYAFSNAIVPEPGSLALLAMGGLCVLRRRRSN